MLIISFVSVIYLFNDGSLEKKRTTIFNQAGENDISKLFILKDTTISYTMNHYQITKITDSTYVYTDQYLFEKSYMTGIEMIATFPYKQDKSLDEDDKLLKIKFKNENAYYGKLENIMKKKITMMFTND